MIDTSHEQLRSLIDATQFVPGQPHVSTLVRWWRLGIQGVKLETVLVGGRRFTSLEAIDRFIQRRNGPSSGAEARYGMHNSSSF
ncbi:MAG: DUF1580 domain-containing protein [Planctomycetia bacterium]|nr:DUF1580 domain-containing protein [Planctomycetia bacterium]